MKFIIPDDRGYYLRKYEKHTSQKATKITIRVRIIYGIKCSRILLFNKTRHQLTGFSILQ